MYAGLCCWFQQAPVMAHSPPVNNPWIYLSDSPLPWTGTCSCLAPDSPQPLAAGVCLILNLNLTPPPILASLSLPSTLETTFDGSVTTEVSGRGMLNLSPRPNPALPWRLCPSSPRLQAGDAPSVGNGYAVVMRGSSSGMVSPEDGRYLRSRQTPGQESNTMCDLSDKMEELEGVTIETTGYMSDGDVLGKNIHMDKVTSG